MVLWHGTMYRDDRVFILDLQLASKGDRQVWAVTTRRNMDGFPPFRVDDFETREKAVEFIQRIEPTTPRISFGGKPLNNPVSYDEYVTILASLDAGSWMAGRGQFSSLFFLRPTNCATMRPPPKNTMAP